MTSLDLRGQTDIAYVIPGGHMSIHVKKIHLWKLFLRFDLIDLNIQFLTCNQKKKKHTDAAHVIFSQTLKQIILYNNFVNVQIIE